MNDVEKYGRYTNQVLGPLPEEIKSKGFLAVGIQWIKGAMASKPPKAQPQDDVYRTQPKASELPIIPPYKLTQLMSGSIAVPVDLEEDFKRHVSEVAALPKPDYGVFEGDNPQSIWANMGPKTPHNE